MIDIEFLRYPIGKFVSPQEINSRQIKEAIAYLKIFPQFLRDTLVVLDEEQLNTPYRPGGWTVKQVIHHLADSHMHAFIRLKQALTADNPTIMPYEESKWAEKGDYNLPLSTPISIVGAVHHKLGALLDEMSELDFNRTYYHPELEKSVSLSEHTIMYHWHSKHHLAHIQHLMIREKW